MYIFGQFSQAPIEDNLLLLEKSLPQIRGSLISVNLAQILADLGILGRALKEPLEQEFLLQAMREDVSFDLSELRRSIEMIPSLLDPDGLLRRVRAELGNPCMLDGFVPKAGFNGRIRAFPLGVLLHVSAGNIFLGALDSLIMGFLSKNNSILKATGGNLGFLRGLIQIMQKIIPDSPLLNSFCVLSWKGGDSKVENRLKALVDGIMAWGGAEMVQSYRSHLPTGVKLIEYGPRISMSLLTKEGWNLNPQNNKRALDQIASEVSFWDQSACASPQWLWVEEGLEPKTLLENLARAMQNYPVPRGPLSADEAIEIHKERHLGFYTSAEENGLCLEGKNFLIHLDPANELRPSPGNRTLIVKTFKNLQELPSRLQPWKTQLQSLSYLCSKDEKRIIETLLGPLFFRQMPLGQILIPKDGAPHDGRYGLNELVRLCASETSTDIVDFVNQAIDSVPYYKNLRQGKWITQIEEMPFLNASILKENSLNQGLNLLSDSIEGGRIFGTGGTKGACKYVFYPTHEFDAVADLLASCYRKQGLKPKSRVANLFAAGNLWSSFLVIEKALEQCDVWQFPLGAQADRDLIQKIIQEFDIRILFGLPSFMLDLARSLPDLKIDAIYFAGEHFLASAREFLHKAWGVKQFISAGYASVDAGPIGYPCPDCKAGEHHVFSQAVYLESIEEEAVVTSWLRQAMPVIRLKTGDRITFLPDSGSCQSKDPKFMLLGRMDDLINIFACRIPLADIEKVLKNSGYYGQFQIQLKTENNSFETMHCLLEGQIPANLARQIYLNCGDIKETWNEDEFLKRIQIKTVTENSLERIARTGKIRRILDQRS